VAERAPLAGDRDDAARDRAHGLLRELLADVPRDRPPGAARAPSSREAARRRRAVRGPIVAAVAVGVLSFGGVAAASTQVAAGNPLHGLGTVVRAAAAAVTGSTGPVAAPAGVARPMARASASAVPAPLPASASPGSALPGSALPGSAPPVPVEPGQEVDQLLGTADELLAAGQVEQAQEVLAEVERALAGTPEVADGADRRGRAAALRKRVQKGAGGASQSGTVQDQHREQGTGSGRPPGRAGPSARPSASADPGEKPVRATKAPSRKAPASPRAVGTSEGEGAGGAGPGRRGG
jgi:hypothetical protein